MSRPFISVGVTTYKRKKMLSECLASILAQTFQDFEILVGNDDPNLTLDKERIEYPDKRIKIINHRKNIGEIANLNFLLAQSRGQYFTWLADDDAYFNTFFESVALAIKENRQAQVTFTSYCLGVQPPDRLQTTTGQSRLLTGREFLRGYLSETIKVAGTLGVFDRRYLLDIGGTRQLGTGFGPYSDTRLAIISGSLENINYIDKKLVFCRTHEGSISFSSPDFDAYRTAQIDLITECIEVFEHHRLTDDFDLNLERLLGLFLGGYQGVMKRSEKLDLAQLYDHLILLLRYCRLFKQGRTMQRARMIFSTFRFLRELLIIRLRNMRRNYY